MNDINLETVEQISNEKIKVALKLILKEMNFKDEMILKLKRENEELKRAIEELKNDKGINNNDNNDKNFKKIKEEKQEEKKEIKTPKHSNSLHSNTLKKGKPKELDNLGFNNDNEIDINKGNFLRYSTVENFGTSAKLQGFSGSKIENKTHKKDRSSSENYQVVNSEPNKINSLPNVEKRNEIKKFLETTKSKLPNDKFKQFLLNIKGLTAPNSKNKKITQEQKNEIINNVKIIFGDDLKELYFKFQELIIKKDK